MTSGNRELSSLDEQSQSTQAELAAHEEFMAQQQRIERLNAYYDDVVAELRIVLEQSLNEAN